jgi:hypothetical protein
VSSNSFDAMFGPVCDSVRCTNSNVSRTTFVPRCRKEDVGGNHARKSSLSTDFLSQFPTGLLFFPRRSPFVTGHGRTIDGIRSMTSDLISPNRFVATVFLVILAVEDESERGIKDLCGEVLVSISLPAESVSLCAKKSAYPTITHDATYLSQRHP